MLYFSNLVQNFSNKLFELTKKLYFFSQNVVSALPFAFCLYSYICQGHTNRTFLHIHALKTFLNEIHKAHLETKVMGDT